MRAQWRKFADEYLICWKPTEAARRAGYAERSIHNQAYRLMRNDEIIEYIGKRLDELQMSADEAIVHLTRIARAPQAKALEFRGYDMAKVAREYADLVQKVKITKPAGEKGVDAVELVFYSRQEALKTILQAHEKIEKPSQVSVEVRLGFGGVLDRVYGDDPGEGKP